MLHQLGLLIALIIVATQTLSFTPATQRPHIWTYVVTATSTHYEISRIDVDRKIAESIYTLTRNLGKKIGEVLSADEVQAAANFANTPENSISNFLSQQMALRLDGIRVSPDQQQIALLVRQEACFRYPRWQCFGKSGLMLYSVLERTTRTLFEISYNSAKYFGKECGTSDDTHVSEVQWARNNKFLIVSLKSGIWCEGLRNLPIFLVQLDGKSSILGYGASWALSQRYDQLAFLTVPSLAEKFNDQAPDILTIVDLADTWSFKSRNVIIPGKYTQTGIFLFLDSYALYGAFDLSFGEISETLSAFVTDQTAADQLSFYTQPAPPFPSDFKNGATSPDGHFAGMLANSKLWLLEMEKGQPKLKVLTERSVKNWHWRSDGTLFVQSDGEDLWRIMDTNGKEQTTVDLDQYISKPIPVEILFVD